MNDGNPDEPLSLQYMVRRLWMASGVICWKSEQFLEPVYAYLKRKLKHIIPKVLGGPSPSAPPSTSSILLKTDAEYYACMGEHGDDGKRLYYAVRLIQFKIWPEAVSLVVHVLDETNTPQRTAVLTCLKSSLILSFIPKAEFEAKPSGTIIFLPHSTIDADCRQLDWSSYDRDTSSILSALAARCARFKLDSSMLPSIGAQSPFPISRGGSTLQFTQVNFGMSFKPFFSEQTSVCELQQRDALLNTAALKEINRCFFIHLGVALGHHPVAMQAVFRAHSALLLQRIRSALSQKTHENDQSFDDIKMFEASLQSVMEHNCMIEASVLGILWPQELQVPFAACGGCARLLFDCASHCTRSCKTCAFSFSLSGPTGLSPTLATCSAPALQPMMQTRSTASTSS